MTKRRGFGAIRKLPSKRWQASYTGPDMQRHNAPQTFQARIDAEGWLAAEQRRIEAEGNDWKPPGAVRLAAPTVAEFADGWLAVRRLEPRTRQHYRWLLDTYIVPTFGELTVPTVTPAVVRTWHAGLTTGPTAKAHAYALLKSIMATAIEDELIAANPCRIRGAGKATTAKQIKPATLDELVVLTEEMPDRLRLLVQLSAWCALRFGEVTELRRRDVDLGNGSVRIERGAPYRHGPVGRPKSRAGTRTVHFPPHLAPMIRAHLRDHTQLGAEGLLFWGANGDNLAHSSLLWHFNRAKAAAGREDLTPHALRHTGAVLAAQGGATIAELMARLGHTTPQMAMRYQHASEDRDLILARKLSELAEGNNG